MDILKDWKTKKNVKKERAEKGYSWWDVMDMDRWFLNIVPKMLQELKEKYDGFPRQFEKQWLLQHWSQVDGKSEFQKFVTIQHNDEIRLQMEEDCKNKWNDILDKIIFLFKEADEEQCTYVNKYDENHEDPELEELWYQENHKISVYQDKCLKEGMQLFTTYFRHLWY